MTSLLTDAEQNVAAPSSALLDVRNLRKYFPIMGGLIPRVVANVKAVEDVSFTVKAGEVVGLVGESGSGKTTTGRALLRLTEPTSGEIMFDGVDITKVSAKRMRDYRKEMQIVFQDPYASLNPRLTVEDTIMQAYRIHGLWDPTERRDRIVELLAAVGLSRHHLDRYPHEFSGGQRQRIGIARALAVNPRFILADEPVSALDVSIQAQVINLLQDLREQFGLTILFIAHDLSVVEFISDRVIVMYLGRIVENAPSESLYRNPIHPYTEALLSAIPIPDPEATYERKVLEGDIPSPINPPSGCVFRTRCPLATKACAETVPVLEEKRPGHFAACLRR